VIAVLRSELLKLRTTRTMLGLVAGMTALIVLVTVLNGWATEESFLWERKNQFQLLANGSIASAFAGIAGLMAMSTEFRHGTIRSTLLATPRRLRVLWAKVVVCTLLGAVLGAFGVLLSFGIGRIALSTRDVPSALSGRDTVLVFAGAIAASALWGMFGTVVGAAVRNQVLAIVGLLIWVLFVENILFALVPSVGRYFPATAANVLTQIETPHQLSVAQGTALFVGYVAVAAIAAVLVTERRDVA
jgi:ABC-type transport system involved in multi-copper enzyme maturation permease subunit